MSELTDLRSGSDERAREGRWPTVTVKMERGGEEVEKEEEAAFPASLIGEPSSLREAEDSGEVKARLPLEASVTAPPPPLFNPETGDGPVPCP